MRQIRDGRCSKCGWKGIVKRRGVLFYCDKCRRKGDERLMKDIWRDTK